MAFFGLKLGLDLEMQAAHLHHKFQGVPPPPGVIWHRTVTPLFCGEPWYQSCNCNCNHVTGYVDVLSIYFFQQRWFNIISFSRFSFRRTVSHYFSLMTLSFFSRSWWVVIIGLKGLFKRLTTIWFLTINECNNARYNAKNGDLLIWLKPAGSQSFWYFSLLWLPRFLLDLHLLIYRFEHFWLLLQQPAYSFDSAKWNKARRDVEE